jgi:hypothetical protein
VRIGEGAARLGAAEAAQPEADPRPVQPPHSRFERRVRGVEGMLMAWQDGPVPCDRPRR